MSPPTTPTMMSVRVLSVSTTAGEKVLRGLGRGAGAPSCTPAPKSSDPLPHGAEAHEAEPRPSGMPATSRTPRAAPQP